MYRLKKLTWNPLDSIREDLIYAQYALTLGFYITTKEKHEKGTPVDIINFVLDTDDHQIIIWKGKLGWRCTYLKDGKESNNTKYDHLFIALSKESSINKK